MIMTSWQLNATFPVTSDSKSFRTADVTFKVTQGRQKPRSIADMALYRVVFEIQSCSAGWTQFHRATDRRTDRLTDRIAFISRLFFSKQQLLH